MIREEGCYYVDKTAYVDLLLDEGTHYFLSRPRRFGKSLFLDTLKELFEGNEALFEGLAIHGRRDCSVRHPVLRLSFGTATSRNRASWTGRLMDQFEAGEAAERRTRGWSAVLRHRPRNASPRCRCTASPDRTAGGGAGGRVRQADPGCARRAGQWPARTGTSCAACIRS